MKVPLLSVRIARWIRPTFGVGARREAVSRKTWADATALLHRFATDNATHDNFVNSLLVSASWGNGLALPEVGFSKGEGKKVEDLGAHLLALYRTEYPDNKRRSLKARMVRQVLLRCSFSDAPEGELDVDARAFDAAKRSLEQCFPDHAAQYVERIRAWMMDGGRIK